MAEQNLRHGAIYINRFRLGLVFLYYASVAGTWQVNSPRQNIVFLVGITLMFVYALGLMFYHRRKPVSEFFNRLVLFVDITVFTSTLIAGVMEGPVVARGIVVGPGFFLIYTFFIAQAALLLSPAFVMWIGSYIAVSSVIVSVTAAQYGLVFTGVPELARKIGHAPVPGEVLKFVFLLTVAFAIRLAVKYVKEAMVQVESEKEKLGAALTDLEASRKDNKARAQELRTAVTTMEDFLSTLDDVITDHAAAFEQIAATMEEFTASTELSAESVSNQFKLIEAMNQSSDNLQRNNETIASDLSELTDRMAKTQAAGSEVQKSIANLNETNAQMIESFTQVQDIVRIMGEVADRTNLLALNASIEAARAGEAGRGFSVVAEEVSRLADSSAQNSGKIAEIIGESDEQLHTGKRATVQAVTLVGEQDQNFAAAFHYFENFSKLVNESQKTSRSVLDNLITLKERSSEIEINSKEQKLGSMEIAKAMSNLESTVGNLQSKSQQVVAKLNEIKEQSLALEA